MTIMDEIVKRADGAADGAINIADALAKEGGVEKVCGEPIATVMSAIRTKAVIKFDANGGTGDIPDFIAVHHEIVPLPDGSELTPPAGKEAFLGWATEAAATEPDITAPYVPTEDDTLYAVWGDIFTIEFDANGGEGEIDDILVPNGQSIETLPDGSGLTAPEGKVFGGWATTDSALVADVTAPYTPADDATLYAFWDDEPEPEEEQAPAE